jgi:serine/threonine protein kinase
MSDAKLYTDTHLERLVVIKSLKDGIDQKRILDELAALQAIRSKHVVQVYDIIRDDTGAVAAIIEEYIPGVDLSSAPAPKDATGFLKLIYPIAEGISDIHSHDRIHRDVKRQNMKYDAEGCLKIFDFGLARESGADSSTIGFVGTPGYMAPELYKQDALGKTNFTQAVDVFAFASTALALVLSKLPTQMIQKPPVLPCAAADFSKLPLAVPIEIAAMLNNCLDADETKRPAMCDITSLIGKHLLRDQHRALLISGGSTYTLDMNKKVVQLSVAGQGALDIKYDGLDFVVTSLTGDVLINNRTVAVGYVLPGSCVIVLGAAHLGTRRTFITVDVSHPEVAL